MFIKSSENQIWIQFYCGVHLAYLSTTYSYSIPLNTKNICKTSNLQTSSTPNLCIHLGYCIHFVNNHFTKLEYIFSYFATQNDSTVCNDYSMIHAGRLIEQILHEQGKTVTWFATQLCCTRTNVYKIFRKSNLDTDLLWRVSCILEQDLFQFYSSEYESFAQHK